MVKLIPWSGLEPSKTFTPKPLGIGAKTGASGKRTKKEQPFVPLPQSTPIPQVMGTTPVPAPATFTTPLSEQKYFNDQNWAQPTAEHSKADDEPRKLKYRKREDLAEYEYQLSTLQMQDVDDLYATRIGYRSASADVPAPEEEPPNKKKQAAVAGTLTWKQYDKLSPDQKQAVDFNTRLVAAREADLKSAPAPMSAEKRAQYDKDVEEMFGAEGGSETIAINTVELLKSINFTAVGQDLDEYLSLERAIDAKELKDFKLSTAEPVEPVLQPVPRWVNDGRPRMEVDTQISNPDQLKSPENMLAVDSTAIQLNTAAIEAAMTDAERTFWSVDTALNPITPTKENIKDIPFGFGGQIRDEGIPDYRPDGSYQWTTDRFYDSSWKTLKIPTDEIPNPMKEIRKFFADYEYEPQERRQWFRTMYQRAMNEKQYGQQYEVGTDGTPRPNRTPDEIIEILKQGARNG